LLQFIANFLLFAQAEFTVPLPNLKVLQYLKAFLLALFPMGQGPLQSISKDLSSDSVYLG